MEYAIARGVHAFRTVMKSMCAIGIEAKATRSVTSTMRAALSGAMAFQPSISGCDAGDFQ
jgi:hypothetical protein